MKKSICLILSLFFIIGAFCEEVIVSAKPSGEVAIIRRANKNKTIQEIYQRTIQANPDLVAYPYTIMDSTDLPNDREDRDFWEWDDVSKKVKVNQQKKNEHLQAIQDKKDKKNSGKNKLKILGLTEEEVEALIGE